MPHRAKTGLKKLHIFSQTTYAYVAQQVAHSLGKIKNGKFYYLKNNKNTQKFQYAYVAQQVAHSLGKAEVMGSSPIISSIF